MSDVRHSPEDPRARAWRRLGISRDRLVEFCRRHRIRELALFGSVLRDDFRPDSDVDVLVEFLPGASPSLFDHGRLAEALGVLLGGRRVDLLTRGGLSRSRNHLRRESILRSRVPLDVA
ncbi:MAG: nucleotidyltransferase domain-containing protein [Planctomycetes bacterium]|nr:nucleotidyltransferase domain-containing protein [Planctomycetota bacterium]